MKNIINNKIFIFLCVLPFLEPSGVGEMSIYLGGIWRIIDLGFTALKLAVFAFIIIFAIYTFRRFSLMFYLICTLAGCMIFSSVLNRNINMSVLLNIITVLGFCVLTEFYINYGSIKNFLGVIVFILSFFITINLLTMVVFPDGMYVNNRGWATNYFFGYKNSHIFVYLGFLVSYALYQHIASGKFNWKFYVMSILILAASLISDSSTTGIAMLLCVALILFLGNVRLPKFFTVSKLYFVSMLVSVLLILYNVQEFFSDFIVDVLGKNTTFSNRTKIWSTYVSYIKKNPIFGNGNHSFDDIFSTWTVNQAHNKFLDVVFVGGFIMFIIFSVIFIIASKKLSSVAGSKLYNIFFFLFVAYSVLFLTEGKRYDVYMYFALILVYHIDNLMKIQKLNPEPLDKRKGRIRFTFGGRNLL